MIAALLLVALSSFSHHHAAAITLGDDVCLTGYIMDNFCIDLGHFLDDADHAPLENPELHSFHCLLDVDRCRESGYLVLTDKHPETGAHCLGYRLDDTGVVVEAGQRAGRAGYCTDCTGDDAKPERGFRATVTGTVKELGDGTNGVTGTPVLENVAVLDESVGCATTRVAPVCLGAAPAPPPGSEPDPPTEDCTRAPCDSRLSPELLLRYQINVPAEATADACDGCTLSVELICEEEAWVAIAFSTTGKMIGSEAVIGIPGGGGNVPLKYSLAGFSASAVQPMPDSQQTLAGASVEVRDGRTIVKFTKIMQEPGEIEISLGANTFLWAHGSDRTLGYHGAAKATFELNLSSGASEQVSVPNRAAWLAHGVVAFLAWGVLVPGAVQSSLLRALLPQGPLWFTLHRALNTMAYACFVAIFIIAVVYTSKEGGPHFRNSHQQMGLAMFVLAFVQVSGGVFRPHVPDAGGEKSAVRKAWEVGHRVLGVALLSCGFWQMRKGIELYAIKYSVSENDEGNLTVAYWVWIGVMSAIIILGGGYFKVKSQSSANTDNGDGVEVPKAATVGGGV